MEFKNNKAIYLQIADYVCENILRKVWVRNEKISSIRDIATELEVNPNTVTRSYSYLEELGIIKMQRGVGYFVAENALSVIVNLKKQAFFNDELPALFRMMKLMNIGIHEITKLYSNPMKEK